MDKKLKVFTAFSGYDSQCLGLNRLKDYDKTFDYELVGWSEIDKGAITAHDALFPEYADINYGDISKIDWQEVPDFDLFTYSSPCFIAGTHVIIRDEQRSKYGTVSKNIEHIKEGDFVLTHNNVYKEVKKLYISECNDDLIEIELYGNKTVTCTKNHPFYIFRDNEYQWISASDLKIESDYIANSEIANIYRPIVQNNVIIEKIEGAHIVTKIKRMTLIRNERCTVYNLEVEDDHSYTANGMFVHNCTDFSNAGKQAGGEEGSGTRSSLLWECKKTILAKHPDYLLFENVPAILQDKFKGGFEKWLKFLRQEGYNNYWDILNAADYGVPQNRERLFIVSIKKELDKVYSFPGKVEEHPHLYEILESEDDVDPKFIRSNWRREHYIELEKDALDKLDNPKNSYKDYEVMPMGVYCHSSDAFVAPPLYDISRTLKTESIEAGIIYKKQGKWNMRLFTQRECFRLMGLTDEEIDKFDGKVKATHQSRCAGNSIVVNVLFHIFRRLFTDTEKPDKNGGKYVLF